MGYPEGKILSFNTVSQNRSWRKWKKTPIVSYESHLEGYPWGKVLGLGVCYLMIAYV